MFNQFKAMVSRTVASAALLAFVCYFVLLLVVLVNHNEQAGTRSNRLNWSEAKSGLVGLRILQQSVHYALGTDDWGTLLPSGRHIVHVEDETGMTKTFSVTLFHQLRCLDVLQMEYSNENLQSPSPVAMHCFNYLREAALCQMDVRAEAQFITPRREGQETICNDWTMVYKQAEQNHALYLSKRAFIPDKIANMKIL